MESDVELIEEHTDVYDKIYKVIERDRSFFIDNRARSILEQDVLEPLKSGGLWRDMAVTREKL